MRIPLELPIDYLISADLCANACFGTLLKASIRAMGNMTDAILHQKKPEYGARPKTNATHDIAKVAVRSVGVMNDGKSKHISLRMRSSNWPTTGKPPSTIHQREKP